MGFSVYLQDLILPGSRWGEKVWLDCWQQASFVFRYRGGFLGVSCLCSNGNFTERRLQCCVDRSIDWLIIEKGGLSDYQKFRYPVLTRLPSPFRLYHHTTPLSQLKKGSDYSLFRGGLEDMKGIRPEWEDAQNREGGQWKLALESSKVGKQIDDIFRELVNAWCFSLLISSRTTLLFVNDFIDHGRD